MKQPLLLSLSLTAIIFIGCGSNKEENNNQNSSITINKIEKSITKKQTNLGCNDKEHNGSKECKQEEENSAQFILNTLAKESSSNNEHDIKTIKENLSSSLEEITKEENKQDKLKNSLVALVDKVNTSKGGKGKDLQSFVENIDDSEFENEDEKKLGTPNTNKIASIKDELTNLVELDDLDIKPKEVKKKLESLISNVTESKKSLSQTQKSLKNLVKKAEEKNTPSAKKFANAIIQDVSNKKVSIIEENTNFLIIKVNNGDNLSILAQRYYNDRSKYKIIYEANKDKINSKYEIYPGSKLLIPKI
ncbi:MAG TPA: LysM peptidoglycan-binding domain-containing protein [Campylobacterales bacterium]|nr:LysM peptidoglycan-binding domain-containing protein [Arcobacter sp.]HHD80649.1 LysM peptidoglycan-binding domain-containing protein [Campylobacterales bacterium]